MLELKMTGDDWKDIKINDEIVLHINRNSDGYSVDIYENYKGSYDDVENYADYHLAGTYVLFSEMEKYQED